MEDKPLYTVDYEHTLADYRKFCRHMVWKMPVIITLVIVSLSSLLQAPRGFGPRYYIVYTFVTLIGSLIVIIGAFTLLFYIYTNRSWKSNKAPKLSHFSFFSDRIQEFDGLSTIVTPYKNIYAIEETNEYFFIMLTSERGHIIKKDVCTEELSNFIRNIKKNAA